MRTQIKLLPRLSGMTSCCWLLSALIGLVLPVVVTQASAVPFKSSGNPSGNATLSRLTPPASLRWRLTRSPAEEPVARAGFPRERTGIGNPPAAPSHSVNSDSAYGPGKFCPQPALSRLIQHKVVPGETIASIAQRYNLIPATLMGMNPALQQGQAAVGSEIVIPPYNGIRTKFPAGQSWRSVAAKYKVRTDVLFEVNGCQKEPRDVFVPGVNWYPQRPATPIPGSLAGYPLPAFATVGLGYGWRVNSNTGKVFFNSGVDLLAPTGTPVRVIGAGTVAFAGERGVYGNLVVVNHQGGQQTRYASLDSVNVHVGQIVKPGDLLGTVGSTGKTPVGEPHLHFEVRYASSLGWVAEDPGRYLQQKQVAR